MSADHYSRVSQGGEGRLRRVSPEENRRLNIEALRAGRSDVAQQRGWNLAVWCLESDDATAVVARAWWAHESDSDVAWADVSQSVRNAYEARAHESLAALVAALTAAPGGPR